MGWKRRVEDFFGLEMAETMRLWNCGTKGRDWMIGRLWVHLQKGRLDADGLGSSSPRGVRLRLGETAARLLRPVWPVLDPPEMAVLELPEHTLAQDGVLPLVNNLSH